MTEKSPGGEQLGQARPYSVRLYPGAQVRLNTAWLAGGLRLEQGSRGWIRGWSKDNRPQVEFDQAPGRFVAVDEQVLVAV
jgi:hypothetical protein